MCFAGKVSTVATAFKRLPSASAAPKKGPKSRPATARSTLKQLSQQDGGTGEHFLGTSAMYGVEMVLCRGRGVELRR